MFVRKFHRTKLVPAVAVPITKSKKYQRKWKA